MPLTDLKFQPLKAFLSYNKLKEKSSKLSFFYKEPKKFVVSADFF